MKALMIAAALGVGTLAVAAAGNAATETQPSARSCFHSSEWRGWKAKDEHTMYARVGLKEVYEIGFSSGCRRATSPGVHLVTVHRGSNTICAPIDLDIKVADSSLGGGFATPCIASSLRRLSAGEAAAIPKQFRP